MSTDETSETRKADHGIAPFLLHRWSPRSMTGEALSDEELFSLFEAARWAPSSYNEQPWILLYAKRDTPEWSLFFDILIEFNQRWVKNAAVLICFVSRNNFAKNGKPSVTHSFDTGAAWMGLALEASHRGLVAHGMSGFDYEKARKNLNIPQDCTVEAMIAVGKRAPAEHLPEDIRAREIPSTRKPIEEFTKLGAYTPFR